MDISSGKPTARPRAPPKSPTSPEIPTARSDLMSLTSFDGAVYFAASNGTDGYQLWKTDGTPAGTAEVTDIAGNPNSPFPGLFPTGLEVVGNSLYFQGAGSASGWYRSDGTTAGTAPLAG